MVIISQQKLPGSSGKCQEGKSVSLLKVPVDVSGRNEHSELVGSLKERGFCSLSPSCLTNAALLFK